VEQFNPPRQAPANPELRDFLRVLRRALLMVVKWIEETDPEATEKRDFPVRTR
jgi:hypothetical protein